MSPSPKYKSYEFKQDVFCEKLEQANIAMAAPGPANPYEIFKPNGKPVPAHWAAFQPNEMLTIKNHSFKVAYIGNDCMVLEPLGVIEISSK